MQIPIKFPHIFSIFYIFISGRFSWISFLFNPSFYLVCIISFVKANWCKVVFEKCDFDSLVKGLLHKNTKTDRQLKFSYRVFLQLQKAKTFVTHLIFPCWFFSEKFFSKSLAAFSHFLFNLCFLSNFSVRLTFAVCFLLSFLEIPI